ncbi:MAG: hypothetical protein H8E12_08655 [Rhodobacteraceae bacterium]|nr:hypothetical protein [Paracoccaceae bacterium]
MKLVNFERFVDLAKALVDKNHRHVSFIVRRNKIISIGTNNLVKTHTRNLNYDYRGRKGEDIRREVGVHSELSAVLKMSEENLTKHSLVNVRINKNGRAAMSKPCKGCLDLVRQLNFNKVYYTNNKGQFEQLNHIK